MDPQDRELLRHSVELSEENRKILKKIHRIMRWAQIWGFLKLLLILLPLILGFLWLRPYFGPITDSLNGINDFMRAFR